MARWSHSIERREVLVDVLFLDVGELTVRIVAEELAQSRVERAVGGEEALVPDTGSLDRGFHEELLVHPDPTFRAWGVRSAGEKGDVEPRLRGIGGLSFQKVSDGLSIELAR